MSWERMLIVVTSVVLFLGSKTIRGEVDVGVVYRVCGEQDVPDGDGQDLIDRVSYDLVHHSAQEGFNHYAKVEWGYLNVFGRAVCHRAISFLDCTTCLNVADNHRISDCKFTRGSQIMLKS